MHKIEKGSFILTLLTFAKGYMLLMTGLFEANWWNCCWNCMQVCFRLDWTENILSV